MSLAPAAVPERQPSPGGLNLSSNNPFRNRMVPPPTFQRMPSADGPLPSNMPARPVGRNPFLDVFADDADTSVPQGPPPPYSSTRAMSFGNPASSREPALMGNTAGLFDNLTLNDRPTPNGQFLTRNPTVPNHSASRSTGDQKSGRLPPSARPQRPSQEPLDIFADPIDVSRARENRRPRGNSESSAMDRASKIFAETEQEERRRRRREREARHKDERRREKGSSSRSKRHLQTLDLIDKLDVTGLYGPGQFHHDGPFDACNPHRNRKKDGRAPMQAFPEDSTNNALGGPGPLNKNIDLNLFHGRTADATQDFGSAGLEPEGIRPRGADRPEDFNANQRITQVHGDESMGLGTSTFLEGAPASRSAIQRRQSETEGTAPQFAGGLQRKRSLAQRIRGISANPHSNGRIVSPEPRYDFRGSGELSPRQPITVQSAGGRSRLSEKNPFFHDYDDAYEKKGASIKIAENERTGRARTPSSPMRGLERRSTSDGYGEPESKPSGFLSRVKSIKGPRRSRPER